MDEGFDDVIEDRGGELQTGKSFDKVLELIGPATLKNTFAHVSEGGIVCCTGLLGGEWCMNSFEPIMELPSNGYLTSFCSGNVSEEKIQEMLDYVYKHKVDASPARVFSLEEVPEAHKYLDSNMSYGKVVCVTE